MGLGVGGLSPVSERLKASAGSIVSPTTGTWLPRHSDPLTETHFVTMPVSLRPLKTGISKFYVLSRHKISFTMKSTQVV